MADTTLADFAAELQRRVEERLESEPDQLAQEAFVGLVAEHLIDDGILDDFENVFLRLTWGNRRIEVSGYDISDDESVLDLVVADFPSDGTTLRRDRIDQLVRRAGAFAEFCRDGLHEQLEHSSPPYDMAQRINTVWKKLQKIRIFVVTDSPSTVTRANDTTIADLPVMIQVWDLTRLHRLITSGRQQEEVVVDLAALGHTVACLPSAPQSDGYRCLLAVLPGTLLAQLYDEHHSRLLQRNVRAFLQVRGKVNQGIAETIRNSPGRFLAYNNGISATAREVDLLPGPDGVPVIGRIRDLQIVNGGQTTASLHHAARRGADLSEVHVPAKITVIPDERIDILAPYISRYANSQNAVTAADFEGNSPFHIGLERLSRSIWTPPGPDGGLQTHWYYERVRGQYDVDKNRHPTAAGKRKFEADNPRRQRFGKTDAAKFELTYQGQPHIVSLGAQKCFQTWTINARLTDREAPSAEYFRRLVAKAILFIEMRRIIQKENFGGYLGQTTAYTLAFLVDRVGELDLDLVWRLQDLPGPVADATLPLARKVRSVLVTPPGSANVTEWCKKVDCWNRVRSLRWEPPSDLLRLAVPR